MLVLESVAIAVFFLIYAAMALQPAGAAYFVVSKISAREYESGEQSGFWKLFDRVRQGRSLAGAALWLSVAAFAAIDLWLLLKVLANFNFDSQTLIITVVVLCLVAAYLAVEFYSYGKVNIARAEHGRAAEAKRLLENVSITAGVAAPELVILAHTNPTAFSAKRNLEDTKIFLTTALLNLCSGRELEAVLAREAAFHATLHNSFLRSVNNRLLLLKLFGFFTLFLALFMVNQDLPLALLATLGLAYLRLSLLNDWPGGSGDPGAMLMHLVNPPLALATFISSLLQYSLAWEENVFADLEAVDYTRYPAGLYSILSKIQNYQQPVDFLPREFAHLYLTGEQTVRGQAPMFQPAITDRLAVLGKLDATLAQVPVSAADKVRLDCPVCHNEFLPLNVVNSLGQDKTCFVCPISGLCWFDAGSLYQLSNVATLGDLPMPILDDVEPAGSPCPRCGVALEGVVDPFLPKNIHIFHCLSCSGDLLTTADLKAYMVFRAAKSV